MRADPHSRRALFTPGVALLPEDFPGRLDALRNAAGLTWQGFAARLGVESRQVLRWRRGTWPCGGAMLAICRLAATVPGGLDILLGERTPGASAHLDLRLPDLPPAPTGALMPADFAGRLEVLRKATGLSWEGFSTCLGADPRQVLRWRRGAEPCGGAMLAVCRLASIIPGGLEALLGGRIFPAGEHGEDAGDE